MIYHCISFKTQRKVSNTRRCKAFELICLYKSCGMGMFTDAQCV